jgi:hypothetical protein
MLVNFLGLPADPTWADHILGIVEGKKRIEEIGRPREYTALHLIECKAGA